MKDHCVWRQLAPLFLSMRPYTGRRAPLGVVPIRENYVTRLCHNRAREGPEQLNNLTLSRPFTSRRVPLKEGFCHFLPERCQAPWAVQASPYRVNWTSFQPDATQGCPRDRCGGSTPKQEDTWNRQAKKEKETRRTSKANKARQEEKDTSKSTGCK